MALPRESQALARPTAGWRESTPLVRVSNTEGTESTEEGPLGCRFSGPFPTLVMTCVTQVAETPKAARRVSVTSVASVFESSAEGCGGSLRQRREATPGFRALPGLCPLCLSPGCARGASLARAAIWH